MCTKQMMIFIMLSGIAAFCLASADIVTKIFQNGKDGYTGCYDSYTYSFNPEDNYSTNETLFNHNCQN